MNVQFPMEAVPKLVLTLKDHSCVVACLVTFLLIPCAKTLMNATPQYVNKGAQIVKDRFRAFVRMVFHLMPME